MTGTLTLGCSLIAGSLALLLWHLRSWRHADNGALNDRDYQFYRRQFFLRLAASGTMGVIGGMMLGDVWVRDPHVKLIYWAFIAGLVVLMVLLAMRDWLSSRLYLEREAATHAAEHAQLRAEIERFRRENEAEDGSV